MENKDQRGVNIETQAGNEVNISFLRGNSFVIFSNLQTCLKN